MAEYTFDVQKLYIEMLLADAESFARAQNIFKPESFDRKLQPIAKFVKDYIKRARERSGYQNHESEERLNPFG